MGFGAQRMSDGPTDIFPGGKFRTGTLVSKPVADWSFTDGKEVELQLVEPHGSRIVGVFLHEGQPYIQAELGFISGRFSGLDGAILKAIVFFKRWHEDALRDGRVILRLDGMLYERQAVLESDPEIVAALRLQLEKLAAAAFAPAPLPEAPTDGPNDIWFFRLDPRPAE